MISMRETARLRGRAPARRAAAISIYARGLQKELFLIARTLSPEAAEPRAPLR